MVKKFLNIGTVFSGIGSPEQALKRLHIPHKIIFACDNGDCSVELDSEKYLQEVKAMKTPEEKRIFVDTLCRSKSRAVNYVKQTYLANYKVENDAFYRDITLFDGTDYAGQLDLFVGGSPCQSFSKAGKRLGFEDTRGTLFFDYCRIIKEIQPKVFIYENVKNVVFHDHGNTWKIMCAAFKELGYYTTYKVLNAADYGIPQKRNRVFVIGFKDEEAFKKFKFPSPVNIDDCELNSLQSMLEENAANGTILDVNGRLSHINDEKGVVDEKYFLAEKSLRYVLAPGTKKYFHPDTEIDKKIARTLVKNSIRTYRAHVNNYVTTYGRLRHLTERECMRIMGYPDDFKIVTTRTQATKQAGNSIVVDVMMALIREVVEAQNWEFEKN